jgi:hypothetical protein
MTKFTCGFCGVTGDIPRNQSAEEWLLNHMISYHRKISPTFRIYDEK